MFLHTTKFVPGNFMSILINGSMRSKLYHSVIIRVFCNFGDINTHRQAKPAKVIISVFELPTFVNCVFVELKSSLNALKLYSHFALLRSLC